MAKRQPQNFLSWKKSSASGPSSACVEMARMHEIILVRDSKDPSGPVLSFSVTQWTTAVQSLFS